MRITYDITPLDKTFREKEDGDESVKPLATENEASG